tara:strand:- start:122 stop:1063 length:942 start_codon:yes stop_codon:yes gene_type:complete
MVKKIIITVFSLLLLVYLVFFEDFFNLNFNDKQLETLIYLFKVYVGASMVAFVVSEIFQNYSQVDKLWSTIPIYYVWYFTAESGYDPRMILMSIVATMWGLRLSYNFGRRGGYSIYFWVGEEDYRWKELKRIAPFLRPRLNWAVFNLFFICLYQMGLVFLITLPILAAWQGTNDISTYDYLIALLMVSFIIIETLSDQQQYNFQTEKYKKIDLGKNLSGDYKRGFVSTGLWSISRHPNFTSEQLIWIVFYLFSISATGNVFNWSIIGCVLLVILFYNSAKFSEGISSAKYADYKIYQKNVPMFLGFWNSNWKK